MGRSADDNDGLTLGTTTPSEDISVEESQTSELSSQSDGEQPIRDKHSEEESTEKKGNIKP